MLIENINFVNQESGIRNQESGIRNQESGIRNQESGIRNQRSIIYNSTLKSSFLAEKFQIFLINLGTFYYLRGASLDTLNSLNSLNSLESRRTTKWRKK